MSDRNVPLDINAIPLIGGHPVVDFVNTVEARHERDEINYLDTPDRFVAWAVRAGLFRWVVTQEESRSDKGCDADLHIWRKAMRLRDDLHRTFISAACDQRFPEEALKNLSKIGQWAGARLQFVSIHRTLRLQPKASLSASERALVMLVAEAASLLTSDAMARVKKCANDRCDWIFLDQSKSGRRRWCRMEACGNREKVRRHRNKAGRTL